MYDHCINLRIVEKLRHRLEIAPVVFCQLLEGDLVVLIE